MSKAQLVMQDAELEFDAESQSQSHEDEDEVGIEIEIEGEAVELQEVTAETEEALSDELLAPEL
ncbi:MAG: hypothetical protein ACRCWL_04345, partial [Aeromonas sp.]